MYKNKNSIYKQIGNKPMRRKVYFKSEESIINWLKQRKYIYRDYYDCNTYVYKVKGDKFLVRELDGTQWSWTLGLIKDGYRLFYSLR